ncbi:uncharacterized protein CCOS01_10280, partial [Colletotrichum costaricense]
SVASSSTSVTSSVLQYRTENGRTYHGYKDGSRLSLLILNEQKLSSLTDIQHNMFILTFDNQLGRAPVNAKNTSIKVGRVLDVGTGTGIWAMDFADEHPESEVIRKIAKQIFQILTYFYLRSLVLTFHPINILIIG